LRTGEDDLSPIGTHILRSERRDWQIGVDSIKKSLQGVEVHPGPR
jgi:hypothetical protein